MSAPISDWLRDATPRARPIAPAASPNAVTAGAHLSGRGRRGAVDLIKAARPEGLGPQAGQTGLGAQGAAWPLRNPAAACWPTTVCSGHGRTSPPDELRRKVSALCGASVPARTVTRARSYRSLGGHPRKPLRDFEPVSFPDVNLWRARLDREEDHGTGRRQPQSQNLSS